MPEVTAALARAAEKLTGLTIGRVVCCHRDDPAGLVHLEGEPCSHAELHISSLWEDEPSRGWRYREGPNPVGLVPLPAVQSDPGWWLRALWKAGYRVTFMGRGAVYIHDGRAMNAVAGGEADDPLDALAAALADMGREASNG